ncbi:hypothetical protein [Pseudonocardia adelaidensis]|uniref:hypothetical protein n=1 Tax=Pseudonocardia adelaidensis TaxID=648754 RepID=UPI0031E5BC20
MTVAATGAGTIARGRGEGQIAARGRAHPNVGGAPPAGRTVAGATTVGSGAIGGGTVGRTSGAGSGPRVLPRSRVCPSRP